MAGEDAAKEMTSRERVLLSLDRREPDRIPIFGPNIIKTREPYDAGLQAYLNDFGFDDFAHVGGLVNPPSHHRELPDETFEDGYGCRYKYMGVGLPYCIHSPLKRVETIADVEAFDWPDPETPGMVAGDAKEQARRIRADAGSEKATVVGMGHMFHQYHYLRGFEEWMVDIKLNRGVHEAIADHIHRINVTLLMRHLEEVGEYIDLVMAGDDLGTSTASYMSPTDFRALIKPYYKDLIGRIKGRWPHIRFYMHSHGQIMDLVPDLIECGIDVLNPVLPLDNMDPVRLKQAYGNDLCFHGGIDIEHIVLFGSVDEVRDHVKEVIDVLGPGGGYWFKAQAISPVIPPENVIAAYECAMEYGGYG